MKWRHNGQGVLGAGVGGARAERPGVAITAALSVVPVQRHMELVCVKKIGQASDGVSVLENSIERW